MADWTGRRPFVFACAAVILAIPFVSGTCSVNGFKAELWSGVYITAAPPALFLVAAKARFHLVGSQAIKRLILTGIFIGLILATIYRFVVTGTPYDPFYLPGQPALNIAGVYLSCIIAITLILVADFSRPVRIAGYGAVLVMIILGLMTGSRTFLVAGGIAVGAYLLTIRGDIILRREMSLVGGVVLAVLAVSFFAFRGSLTRLAAGTPHGFFDGRLQSWADAFELFRRYPLCGIGHGIYYDRALNPLYLERDRQGINYIAFYHAHDIYLNTLAEGGIIMGLLLAVLITAAAYGCYRVLSADARDRFGLIAAILLAMLLMVGLFENTLVQPVIFPLAIFLGLAMNVTWRRLPAEVARPVADPASGVPGSGDKIRR